MEPAGAEEIPGASTAGGPLQPASKTSAAQAAGMRKRFMWPEDTRRLGRGQTPSAASSTARNSASTMAVAPHTRTPPTLKQGTSISP